MPTPDPIMPIALLSQAGEPGRHLREALAEAGTPIVYESQAADLDRDALEQSGARVVVVNLDSEVEAHLDDIYALLDDDRYNVIFNEAQVSSQLSGWEQARWARHLASKIIGARNADPPRPAGAEPVPQRMVSGEPIVQVEDSAAAETEPVVEITDVVTDEDQMIDAGKESNPGSPVQEVTVSTDDEDDDFGDLGGLLEDPGPSLNYPSNSGSEAAIEVSDIDAGALQIPTIDLSEFDDFDEPSTSGILAVDEFSDPLDTIRDPGEEGIGIEFANADHAVDLDETETTDSSDGDALGFGDLDDFAGDPGSAIEEIELDSSSAPPPPSIDSRLADAVEEADAAASGNELADLQLLDLDWSEERPPATPNAEESAGQDQKLPRLESAFSWELENPDEATRSESTRIEAISTKPSDFGIETVSAADYLAPDAEVGGMDDLEPGISLELIPLEDSVSHGAQQRASIETESWLDTSNKTAVSRVWVLGASIGGPEAVREFLADIPANCPALFLLAQHMGAEFMEIMAQQLTRSTKLTVRTPSHGERVAHGDLLIVPTTHRMRIDRAGVVTLEAQPTSNRSNLPSIDQVLEDVADRFGSKAGAIIFSGMAEDAAEGARYLTEIGGLVFAQDPESCVISSMVDGVIETGVVSFIGSPKQLANKLLGELNFTATT